MKRTLSTTAVTLLIAGLAACSSNSGSGASDQQSTKAKAGASATPTTSKPLDASSAFTQISGKVTSAKQSGTVTAANDPNHLLGRPGQYSSKITFDDTRIPADEVSGTDKGDVERGGAIEAFATAADARSRAKYIATVTKSMPALAEYDFVHGTILVRVSRYLTPAQAAAYKATVDRLS
ncbi:MULTISPECIES: hypothetical protein [unclassified Streptomyces]|uniref:hypothetical protein n=1 Tax=unclassified Streptomyces TaxID=2593676 RepID=UPI0036AFAB9E